MSLRFPVARFHIRSGPQSLFDRIRFKMSDRRELRHNAEHFHDRTFERDGPIEHFKTFDPQTWRLVTADVRIDSGKFVTTAWEVDVAGQIWWVVIGLHDTIKTVIPTNNRKSGTTGIVREGEIYDFVESVNRQLLKGES